MYDVTIKTDDEGTVFVTPLTDRAKQTLYAFLLPEEDGTIEVAPSTTDVPMSTKVRDLCSLFGLKYEKAE